MSINDTDFKLNDLVMHCREGLSTIVDTKVMGENEYFLVKANRGSGETIYVPKNRTSAIIRHLMNEEEADELLKYAKTIEKDFNSNTKQRRDAFKRKLSSGDIKEIAYLAIQLFHYEQLSEEEREVRFGPVDLDMLQYASNMILDEAAITYNVDRDKIKDFLNERSKKL